MVVKLGRAAFASAPNFVGVARLCQGQVESYAGRFRRRAPETSLEPLTKSDEKMLRKLATRNSRHLSLLDLHSFCSRMTPEKAVQQAQFLHAELPVRFASRALELLDLPYGLSKQEPVQLAASWYASIVRVLEQHPKPTTPADEEEFAAFLASLLLDHACVPQALSRGVCEIKNADLSVIDIHRLDRVLDQFFGSRISLRFLIEHYIASHKRRDGFRGVIQSECSPAEVAAMAAADTEELCRKFMGCTPEIQVYGSLADTFTFVPTHLYFILTELLKNSCRATVETASRRGLIDVVAPAVDERGRAEGLPPVKVVVSRGKEDVAIKVADEGGGIRRSDLQHVWSYMYSTAPPPLADQFGGATLDHPSGRWGKSSVGSGSSGGGSSGGGSSGGGSSGGGSSGGGDASKSVAPVGAESRLSFAGYGMGLPLSRLYAQYFGGSLKLRPMEGYGTDAYVHLNRLRTHSTERVPVALEKTLMNMRADGRAGKKPMDHGPLQHLPRGPVSARPQSLGVLGRVTLDADLGVVLPPAPPAAAAATAVAAAGAAAAATAAATAGPTAAAAVAAAAAAGPAAAAVAAAANVTPRGSFPGLRLTEDAPQDSLRQAA